MIIQWRWYCCGNLKKQLHSSLAVVLSPRVAPSCLEYQCRDRLTIRRDIQIREVLNIQLFNLFLCIRRRWLLRFLHYSRLTNKVNYSSMFDNVPSLAIHHQRLFFSAQNYLLYAHCLIWWHCFLYMGEQTTGSSHFPCQIAVNPCHIAGLFEMLIG